MKTFLCSGPYPIGAGPGPGPGLWNGIHRYPARSFQPSLSKPMSWPSTTWCGQALSETPYQCSIHPSYLSFVSLEVGSVFWCPIHPQCAMLPTFLSILNVQVWRSLHAQCALSSSPCKNQASLTMILSEVLPTFQCKMFPWWC